MRGHVGLERRWIEPDRALAHGEEVGFRLRVRTGEERNVVAELDEGIGQVGHNPFRAAIKTRRNCFGQRGNLGDLQRDSLADERPARHPAETKWRSLSAYRVR